MVSTNKNLYICFVVVVVLVKVIIVWLLSFGSFYPLFYAELDFFSHSSQQGARSKSSSSPASTA